MKAKDLIALLSTDPEATILIAWNGDCHSGKRIVPTEVQKDTLMELKVADPDGQNTFWDSDYEIQNEEIKRRERVFVIFSDRKDFTPFENS